MTRDARESDSDGSGPQGYDLANLAALADDTVRYTAGDSSGPDNQTMWRCRRARRWKTLPPVCAVFPYCGARPNNDSGDTLKLR